MHYLHVIKFVHLFFLLLAVFKNEFSVVMMDRIDPIKKVVTLSRGHIHLLREQVKIDISKSFLMTDYNIP